MDQKPLPTVNEPATVAYQTVGELFKIATTAAENAAIVAQPWLGWPVIKQLWQGALEWFVGQIGSSLGTLAGYVVMDVQKAIILNNTSEALTKLKAAQAGGITDEIKKANDEMDKAAADILHYGGQIKK